MDDAALLEWVTDLRDDATRHLTALAGNASMCAIGRSGRSFPAAKYHEGRQAAASQVRRELRRGMTGGGDVLARAAEDWAAALDAAQHKGKDWIAYASGGVDVVSELSEGSAQPNRPEM